MGKTLALLLLAASTPAADAADWPHWRGPNRNDTTREPSGWNDGKWLGEKESWRKELGLGCGSALVVEGRLYTTGLAADRETLFCLDAATGRELWTQSYPAPKFGRHATGDQGIYAGPTATPEFDDETGLLYTLGGDGELTCWNTREAGERVWRLNLYDRFQVGQRPNVGSSSRMLRDYGYTSSPLVHKDWLLVEVGAKAGNLIAFDKRTGEQRWASDCRDEAGHTGGPVPMRVEGIPCVAVLTLRNLVVTRLDPGHEGKTLAEHKWTTDFANNIPTPAVHGQSVLVTSAYNQYAMCRLDVSRDGVRQVWENENPSGVCSPLVHDGRIYWSWRGIHCVDFETGREIWRGGNTGTAGSCIRTGDERLIVLADNGDLFLVETARRSPDKLTVLAERRRLLQSDAWPHVVLADGRLYSKDRNGTLICLPTGDK